MGRGIKRPVKAKKPDFEKKKLKVGRRLKKSLNETKIDLRVAKLSLPSLPPDDGSAAAETPEQKQATINEALRKLSHHNSKVRKVALQSLTSVVQHRLNDGANHLATVFESCIPCLHDDDREVRAAFLLFWQNCIQKNISQEMMYPFAPLVIANIRSSCSHLNIALRLDALKFLQILIAHCPQAIVKGHASSLLHLFVDILSQKHRERSLAAHAYSVTALTVSILEETLAQLETLCQPNFAQDQNDKPDFVIAKAQSHHLGTASTCARDFLHVPGVHSVAFDGDDDNMGLVHHASGGRNYEDGLSLRQALCGRLRTCWDDCGPLQSVASLDEAKLSCMASILNCMRYLLLCTGSGSKQKDLLLQETSEFIHAKVLACFPVAAQHGYKIMYTGAAHNLDDSAARLLVAVLDWVFLCPRLQQSWPGDSTTAIPAFSNNDPQPKMPRAGSLNLVKACVSSSQAFASWTSVQRSCNNTRSAVCGGADVLCDADAETIPPEPNSMLESVLLYCQIMIQASTATGSESGVREVSIQQLSEVLEAAGRLLQLVENQHHEELLQDVTNFLASPLSAARLGICAQFVHRICLSMAENRTEAPVASKVLQEWVENLSHSFVESSLMDSETLQVILRCRLSLCQMDYAAENFVDGLMICAVKLAFLHPGALNTCSVKALVSQNLSYGNLPNSVCTLLCQALERGQLCPQSQLLVTNFLQAML